VFSVKCAGCRGGGLQQDPLFPPALAFCAFGTGSFAGMLDPLRLTSPATLGAGPPWVVSTGLSPPQGCLNSSGTPLCFLLGGCGTLPATGALSGGGGHTRPIFFFELWLRGLFGPFGLIFRVGAWKQATPRGGFQEVIPLVIPWPSPCMAAYGYG